MDVQIFGHKKDPETRKAQRFFAERRMKVHFVDLAERAAAPGELKRFVQKFGVEALIDRAGKRFAERGLRTALYGEARWLELLADDPGLLKTPLVRWQHKLSIGAADGEWKQWLAAASSTAPSTPAGTSKTGQTPGPKTGSRT